MGLPLCPLRLPLSGGRIGNSTGGPLYSQTASVPNMRCLPLRTEIKLLAMAEITIRFHFNSRATIK